MVVAITDELLFKLGDRIYEIGRKSGMIDAGKVPKFISKNKAEAIYGSGNVRKWIRTGLIKKHKDADGKRNSMIRLEVLELETAAFKSNYLEGLSPKGKAEIRDLQDV